MSQKDLSLEEIFLVKIEERRGTGYDYTLCFPSEDTAFQFLKENGFELRERVNKRDKPSHFDDVQLRGVDYYTICRFSHPIKGACVQRLFFKGEDYLRK